MSAEAVRQRQAPDRRHRKLISFSLPSSYTADQMGFGVMSGWRLQAIKVQVIPRLSGMATVCSMLDVAGAKMGAVALHLIGARLVISMRDSMVSVENRRWTVSDELVGRPGRFLINDTVFHVTTSGMSHVVQRCDRNLNAGYRPVLLVPESDLTLVMGYAAMWNIRHRITLSSIEHFVGLHLDELSGYSGNEFDAAFRHLIETYNTRVAAVETDPTLRIVIAESIVGAPRVSSSA